MTEQLGDHYCKVGCYRKALDSYQAQECETWLNIVLSLEEDGCALEELVGCYQSAVECAQRAGLPKLQHRVFQQLLQQKYSRSWAPLTQTALSPDCRTSVGCRAGVMERARERRSRKKKRTARNWRTVTWSCLNLGRG